MPASTEVREESLRGGLAMSFISSPDSEAKVVMIAMRNVASKVGRRYYGGREDHAADPEPFQELKMWPGYGFRSISIKNRRPTPGFSSLWGI